MKNKTVWNKTLALLMTVVMLMSSMVLTLPVNAADANKQLSIKGINSKWMSVDGVANPSEPWETVEWKYFKGDYGRTAANENDRFKLLWDGSNIYFLVEFVDSNGKYDPASGWDGDGFLLYIDESGEANTDLDTDAFDFTWRTGTIFTKDEGVNRTSTNNVEYRVDRRNSDGTDNNNTTNGSKDGQLVRIEAKMPITKSEYAVAGNTIGLNIMIQPHNGTGITQIGISGNLKNTGTFMSCTLGAIDEWAPTIKGVDDNLMVIDGAVTANEPWDTVDWEYFNLHYGRTTANEKDRFKLLWDGTYVYFLIEFVDSNGKFDLADGWNGDGFILYIDESGKASGNVDDATTYTWRTSTQLAKVDGYNVTAANGNEYHRVVRKNLDGTENTTNSGDGELVRIEARMRITTPEYAVAGNTVGFNIMIQPNNGTSISQISVCANKDNASTFIKRELGIIEREIILVNGNTNTEIDRVTVNKGSNFVLPTVDLGNGLPFLGWIVGEQLLPAGTEITVNDNISITAYSIGLSMEDGAAVRLTQTTGMRWITYLDDANLPLNVEIVGKGTLIVPKDYLTEGVAFTHAGLEAAGRQANQANGYLDVVATEYVPESDLYKNANGRKQFNGSILNIQEGNYDRDFVAVGYVKVKYSNGVEASIYADYSECVRNVKAVAEAALADQTATFNTAETAVLKKFAGQA